MIELTASEILSKREIFTALAMLGLCADGSYRGPVASKSIQIADATLFQLEHGLTEIPSPPD